jgi:hypothetical protein
MRLAASAGAAIVHLQHVPSGCRQDLALEPERMVILRHRPAVDPEHRAMRSAGLGARGAREQAAHDRAVAAA